MLFNTFDCWKYPKLLVQASPSSTRKEQLSWYKKQQSLRDKPPLISIGNGGMVMDCLLYSFRNFGICRRGSLSRRKGDSEGRPLPLLGGYAYDAFVKVDNLFGPVEAKA
jgi:hypothetical protein